MTRLTRLHYLAYSLGHVLNDAAAVMWFSYGLFFLHELCNVPAATSGLILFAGQVADAVATPLVGILSGARPTGRVRTLRARVGARPLNASASAPRARARPGRCDAVVAAWRPSARVDRARLRVRRDHVPYLLLTRRRGHARAQRCRRVGVQRGLGDDAGRAPFPRTRHGRWRARAAAALSRTAGRNGRCVDVRIRASARGARAPPVAAQRRRVGRGFPRLCSPCRRRGRGDDGLLRWPGRAHATPAARGGAQNSRRRNVERGAPRFTRVARARAPLGRADGERDGERAARRVVAAAALLGDWAAVHVRALVDQPDRHLCARIARSATRARTHASCAAGGCAGAEQAASA